jgi:hypothetical protein
MVIEEHTLRNPCCETGDSGRELLPLRCVGMSSESISFANEVKDLITASFLESGVFTSTRL